MSPSVEGPWIKALPVMDELRVADDGPVVIADADVWCEGLDRAVWAVTVGLAEWAVPFEKVYRLTEEASERYKRYGECGEVERRVYVGVPGGGLVVAHRDTLLEVPLDPRFEGYGQEDEAWGMALEALKGKPWRGDADLAHLYHPKQPRISERRGSAAGWSLYKRYANAKHFKQPSMDEMIQEAHQAYESHGDTVRRRPPDQQRRDRRVRGRDQNGDAGPGDR